MSLLKIGTNCFINVHKSCVVRTVVRASSSKTFETSYIQASITDDGKTIVCWHPERTFPYDHTKPIPQLASKYNEDESVLKLKHREETDDILNRKDYSEEELMQMTFTPRATWNITNRQRKAHIRYPNPPLDRIGV